MTRISSTVNTLNTRQMRGCRRSNTRQIGYLAGRAYSNHTAGIGNTFAKGSMCSSKWSSKYFLRKPYYKAKFSTSCHDATLLQCSTLETRRSKNKTKMDSWKIINLFPSQWNHKYWDFQLHDTNWFRCDEARYTPRAQDMNWNLRWYVHSFRHSAKFSWHGQGKILPNFMLIFLGCWRFSYAGLTKRATMSFLQTIPNSLSLVRPRTVVLAGKLLG